ncbi:hypothetical protein IC575_001436 [Cucumis melo]
MDKNALLFLSLFHVCFPFSPRSIPSLSRIVPFPFSFFRVEHLNLLRPSSLGFRRSLSSAFRRSSSNHSINFELFSYLGFSIYNRTDHSPSFSLSPLFSQTIFFVNVKRMVVPSDKYFPATMSCQVHKIGSLIKDKLTKEQLQMFDKTIFGPLLNVNMVFNDELIYHFLLRQIPEDGNADEICFSVLGKNVRFTQKEFNIITGLWPTNNLLEKDCDSKRLQSLLFGSENKKLITCLEIEEIFKNFEFTNDDDAVKVALVVFIETVMVGKDKKTQYDMDILGRVDDEEAFKSFDWSTFFYTRLLNSLKTSL